MIYGLRASHFIRQFAGPKDGSQIVCFPFWQLVPAGGCPYKCSYCFLQTTPWFIFNRKLLKGIVYENISKMISEVEKWLDDRVPKMLLVGELQDGLVFDGVYRKVAGKPLTHLLIPLFAAQKRHRLIFLTKSTNTRYALQLDPTPQVIFSWSVNAEEVATKWEKGAPLPSQRLDAARLMNDAGWTVRFRLDPMIPYNGWKNSYARTIDQINSIGPELLTLGALRAHNKNTLKSAAKANKRDVRIFNYLKNDKDPSGFKCRIDAGEHVAAFKFALENLDGKITPALCKEDHSLWDELGIRFRGCNCMLGAKDPLVRQSPLFRNRRDIKNGRAKRNNLGT